MKEKEMKDMKDWEQIAINTYKLPIEGGHLYGHQSEYGATLTFVPEQSRAAPTTYGDACSLCEKNNTVTYDARYIDYCHDCESVYGHLAPPDPQEKK